MNRLFGTNQPELLEQWKVLNSEEQLDQIIKDSYQRPVVLFKHSISCGISAMAKYQLEEQWDFDPEDFDFYYLDLINNRSVSNKIAKDLEVIHQSPQIIVVKNGQSIYDTSHHNINSATLRRAVEQVV